MSPLTAAQRKKALASTHIINWNTPLITHKVQELLQDMPDDPVQKAIRLFYWSRDEIVYRVTVDFNTNNYLKASSTLQRGFGHCVGKSILLTALCRAAGIPARLHFVDLKNYLLPEHWIDRWGEELIYHGYVEIFLNDRWVIATPAYDRALCERHNYIASEFDGIHDSFFPKTDQNGAKFIEYVKDHGAYYRVPFFKMNFAWLKHYGHYLLIQKRLEKKNNHGTTPK